MEILPKTNFLEMVHKSHQTYLFILWKFQREQYSLLCICFNSKRGDKRVSQLNELLLNTIQLCCIMNNTSYLMWERLHECRNTAVMQLFQQHVAKRAIICNNRTIIPRYSKPIQNFYNPMLHVFAIRFSGWK